VEIDQRLHLDKIDKKSLLNHVLKDKNIKRALVFTRTKHGADKVVKDLEKTGVKAAAIHGNKSQNARQKALSDFKSSQIRILVATDIAARGIDVQNLAYVVHFEIPSSDEYYTHRSGRTGRGGKSGVSISLVTTKEMKQIRVLETKLGINFNQIRKMK
jgi:ATP-dependent RNA helicase RhlE